MIPVQATSRHRTARNINNRKNPSILNSRSRILIKKMTTTAYPPPVRVCQTKRVNKNPFSLS